MLELESLTPSVDLKLLNDNEQSARVGEHESSLEFVCKASGSYPAASIDWFLVRASDEHTTISRQLLQPTSFKQLESQKSGQRTMITSSSLVLKKEHFLARVKLICEARNQFSASDSQEKPLRKVIHLDVESK